MKKQTQNYELQKLIITEIQKHNENTSTYTLSSSDKSALAPMKSGQYLSVLAQIGDVFTSRPYSICSSPKDAQKGFYKLTIEKYDGGFFPNFVHDSFKIGDSVAVRGPAGDCCYDSAVDSTRVVLLSGGSAVTPFISMMEAVDEGSEDYEITLIYGNNTKADIIFCDELARLEKNPKIRVVNVLSEERVLGCEHGFITSELIKKYLPDDGDYSLFICGPAAMYAFVDREIEKLNPNPARYHHQPYAVPRDLENREDYCGDTDAIYTLTVIDSQSGGIEKNVVCPAGETILVALERAGIKARALCRSGECGFCKSKLLSGSVYVPQIGLTDRRESLKQGELHPCFTYATSDICIEI
ncbi:MAG: FAD-binding oxidoreductase [Oscillospiraceae bacterium]